MTTVVIYKTGPAGPPGPAGSAGGCLARIAATAIGGFKAVRDLGDGTVDLASSGDPAHAATFLGVTLHAAEPGATADIIRQGEIVDASMRLTPGPLFLGLDGAIVSEPPATGVLVQIGAATASDRAVIDVQRAIIRR